MHGLETGTVVSSVTFWDDCVSDEPWHLKTLACLLPRKVDPPGTFPRRPVEGVKKMVVLPYGFWEQASAEIHVRSGKIAQYF